MIEAWHDPKLVDDYTNMVKDRSLSWFEEEVNIPLLLDLIPGSVSSIHDFGCGPGDVIERLQTKADLVTGSDFSEAMITQARTDVPGVEFYIWDGLSDAPFKPHDLVFAKLVLQFIDDLDLAAQKLRTAINDGGYLLLSVPHPTRVLIEKGEDLRYHRVEKYDVEIGKTGVFTTMINRSIEAYLQPFLKCGFIIDAFQETDIPADILEKHGKTDAFSKYPFRLNVRLQK